MDNLASSTTIAVISLVIDAIGVRRAAFLPYTMRPVLAFMISAALESRNGLPLVIEIVFTRAGGVFAARLDLTGACAREEILAG